MRLKYFYILVLLPFTSSISAQTIFNIEINQAAEIEIDLGNDTILCVGRAITLGGTPTAKGGQGQLFYSWFPAENLDDPTSPNPVATVDQSTTFTVTVIDERGCLAQEFVTIGADLCLGVNDSELEKSISVYPNPTRNKIFIQGPWTNGGVDVEIKLINSIGQVVDKVIIENWQSNNLFEWTLNEPDPGLYFVQLSEGKNILTKKIQIK